MKSINQKKLIGAIIIIIALSLAGFWFGWKLVLVIFLAIMGNNFEQTKSDIHKSKKGWIE